MKLTFSSRHGSIKQLETTELPELCVLTGKNGSGKTHLLKAIQDGDPSKPQKILIEGIGKDRIKYFNFVDFLIGSQQASQRTSIDTLKESAWNFFLKVRSEFQTWDSRVFGIVGALEFPYRISSELIGESRYSEYRSCVLDLRRMIETKAGADARLKALLLSGILKGKKYCKDIERDDFLEAAALESEDFSLSIGLSDICFDYQRRLNLERYKLVKGPNDDSKEALAVMEKNAPWNFVNRLLAEFELNHRIVAPTFTEENMLAGNPQYTCRLELDGDLIDFSELSSGEKVLCALAISYYQGETLSALPKLMLLDEIDASLHPKMIKNLLKVIERVFIENGCGVILTTHSPTTVAIVADESLYEMKKGDVPKRIVKIAREDAISMLSEGLMTLEKALTFVNDIFKKELTIVSEGKNYNHFSKALKILAPDLEGHLALHKNSDDSGSGDTDIKGLYNFVTKIQDRKHAALFIVDCDSDVFEDEKENRNTFHFRMPLNDENVFCKKGIENAYPLYLFDQEFLEMQGPDSFFKKSSTNKDKFWDIKIKESSNPKDFVCFNSFIDKVREILKKTMPSENPKIETPELNTAEVKVPAVEAEGGSREMALAAQAEEQARREAFVKEGGVIVEEPGIANQEAGAAQRDREVAEAKESARREKFFVDLIAKFPELTDVQREAVRATMERERTRTWSDYDGDNAQIRRIAVEGNILTIVVNVEDMYMSVPEKIQF